MWSRQSVINSANSSVISRSKVNTNGNLDTTSITRHPTPLPIFSKKNRDAAKRAVAVIRESVNILAKQPEVGRPVAEMAVEFREWPINFGDNGYVVLYHYRQLLGSYEQQAVILSVKHISAG